MCVKCCPGWSQLWKSQHSLPLLLATLLGGHHTSGRGMESGIPALTEFAVLQPV